MKQKSIIKKTGLCFILSVMMCMAAGCGNKQEERIKSAEEIAVEQKQKAEDVVDDLNEQTKQFEQSASQLEE